MPPKAAVSAEEDIKFLLTIIKQLSGSPNWQQIADELGLGTRGAASKRFSRMPAKYNITMPETNADAASGAGNVPSTPKKAKGASKPKKAASSAKKRKIQEVEEDDEDVDEEIDE